MTFPWVHDVAGHVVADLVTNMALAALFGSRRDSSGHRGVLWLRSFRCVGVACDYGPMLSKSKRQKARGNR